jgi:hypothetical protein
VEKRALLEGCDLGVHARTTRSSSADQPTLTRFEG